MKYIISVYVTLAFLLGANLAYASDVATVAGVTTTTTASNSSDTTPLSETGIVFMDTEGNCLVISAGKHVSACTSEQAEQINRITTQAVSPKVLSATIPTDVVILAEEGKCVVVSKNEGSVLNCTEEQAFALQVLSESFETATGHISHKGYYGSFFGIGFIVLGGLAALIIPPLGLGIGGPMLTIGAIMSLYSIVTLAENRWSKVCNLEEHVKGLILTLDGEALSPLEQIERLQIAYLKDSPKCVPSSEDLPELNQKVATADTAITVDKLTADGFSPWSP